MDLLFPLMLVCGTPLLFFGFGFVAGVAATKYRVKLETRPGYESDRLQATGSPEVRWTA